MEQKVGYSKFLKDLDNRLEDYFKFHKELIFCQKGCSICCEKGDYPLSELELKYLMQGYVALDYFTKQQVQENFKQIVKGGACPFLIDNKCSIYPYRPIICRVHGLAYLCDDNTVKLPYCANIGKNYSKNYKKGEFSGSPIKENLDTSTLLQDFDFGEIRNLYDWIKNSQAD